MTQPKLNLCFNLYVPVNSYRASEVLSCFQANLANRFVDRLVVLSDDPNSIDLPEEFSKTVQLVGLQEKPRFQDFVGSLASVSSKEDVNVFCNSDCILSEKAAKFLKKMKFGRAYCIRRRELLSLSPLRFDKTRELDWHLKVPNCMHDGWSFRGHPLNEMSLDFTPGTPGCDNRFAHELSRAGFAVSEVCLLAPLYHLHRDLRRSYRGVPPVAGPYLHPKAIHAREILRSVRLTATAKLSKLCTRVRNKSKAMLN